MQDAFVASACFKLYTAVPPRVPADAHDALLQFSVLMLQIASLLPNQHARGLGESQQRIVQCAIDAMIALTRLALCDPLTRLMPGFVDLLRALARGTEARAAASPRSVCVPRFVEHCANDFANGFAKAEAFYESLYSGYKRLGKLACAEFWILLDRNLPRLTSAMVRSAIPLLFDGPRLRRGLEVAAACGAMPEKCVSFGINTAAPVFLADGETVVDRERVGRAVQFLLASALQGMEANPPDDPAVRREAEALRRRIHDELHACRINAESRVASPGRALRILLDAVADVAEAATASSAALQIFQYAFAFPCLLPQNLQPLRGYDGGLLSVWDACHHLLKVHAQHRCELLPFHALLSAVFGGVVGNLLSRSIDGPFCLFCHSPVARRIRDLQDAWPSSTKSPDPPDARIRRPDGPRGRMICANYAVCDAIARPVLRAEPAWTAAADARFDAALAMLVATTALSCRPSDGAIPLRRLYFSSLNMRLSAGEYEFAWRDVLGRPLLCSGPLHAFSQRGFFDSLALDWSSRPEVLRAVAARERGVVQRAQAVMLPSEAVALVLRRAQRHVADATTRVDNLVRTVDGPPFVSRVADALSAFANAAYSQCMSAHTWEAMVTGFATHRNKRMRSE
jgi:hypothetical protein